MYKKILVPIDLADPELAKPAVATAVMMAGESRRHDAAASTCCRSRRSCSPNTCRPTSRCSSARRPRTRSPIVVKETGLDPARVSATVRQGGIYQEILEEANSIGADLIVMSSHRPQRHAVRTYFLGSNAGHVVRYAKCSVLVVRK